MKNCVSEAERAAVDVCYKTKSDALLRDVRGGRWCGFH